MFQSVAKYRIGFLAAVLISILFCENAWAFNIYYHRHKAMSEFSGFVVGSEALPQGSFSFATSFSYSDSPLEFGLANSDEKVDDLVERLITQDIAMAISLHDRIALQVHAPLHLNAVVESFSGFASDNVFALGDLTVDLLFTFLPMSKNMKNETSTWGLGFNPFVSIDTGDQANYLGDGQTVLGGHFIVDHWSASKQHYINFNVGARYRPKVERLANLTLGSELLASVAYRYRFNAKKDLHLLAEFLTATGLTETEEINSPAELFLGLQSTTKNRQWQWTLGASRAANNGYGAPNYKMFAGLRWMSKRKERAVLKTEPSPPLAVFNKPEVKAKPVLPVAPQNKPVPKAPSEPVKAVPAKGVLIIKIVDQYNKPYKADVAIRHDHYGDRVVNVKTNLIKTKLPAGVVVLKVKDEFGKVTQSLYQVKAKQNNNYTLKLNVKSQKTKAKTTNGQSALAQKTKYQRVYLKSRLSFPPTKSYLSLGNEKKLDEFYQTLKKQNFKKLIIKSYTEKMGSESLAVQLSVERVQKIKAHLVSLGLSASNVLAIGRGSQDPISSNDTSLGKSKNRRVEFYLYK